MIEGYLFGLPTLIMFATMAASMAVAILAWRQRRAQGASIFALLLLGCALWSFGFAMEAAAPTTSQKIFWCKLGYLGSASAPSLFFLFSWRFCLEREAPLKLIAAAFFVPLMTVLLAWSNHLHHWHWTTVEIDPTTNLSVYGHGFWYWVFDAHNAVVMLSAIVLLLRMALSSPFSSRRRRRAGLLAIAAVLPLLGELLYLTPYNPIRGLDWSSLLIATSAIVAWTLVSGRMFELLPVAREKLFEGAAEAVLVLDSEDHVVELNPRARQLFERSSEASWLLHPLAEVAPMVADVLNDVEGQRDLTLEVDGEPRHWSLSPTVLNEGDSRGRLIVLHDVTTRRELEAKQQTLIDELSEALSEVQTLRELMPICSSCHKIRDDEAGWTLLEQYVEQHAGMTFTHGICPTCAERLYGEYGICREDLEDL